MKRPTFNDISSKPKRFHPKEESPPLDLRELAHNDEPGRPSQHIVDLTDHGSNQREREEVFYEAMPAVSHQQHLDPDLDWTDRIDEWEKRFRIFWSRTMRRLRSRRRQIALAAPDAWQEYRWQTGVAALLIVLIAGTALNISRGHNILTSITGALTHHPTSSQNSPATNPSAGQASPVVNGVPSIPIATSGQAGSSSTGGASAGSGAATPTSSSSTPAVIGRGGGTSGGTTYTGGTGGSGGTAPVPAPSAPSGATGGTLDPSVTATTPVGSASLNVNPTVPSTPTLPVSTGSLGGGLLP